MTVPGCVAVSLRPEFAGPLYQSSTWPGGPRPVLHMPASAAGLSKGPTAASPRPGVDTPGVVSQGR